MQDCIQGLEMYGARWLTEAEVYIKVTWDFSIMVINYQFSHSLYCHWIPAGTL